MHPAFLFFSFFSFILPFGTDQGTIENEVCTSPLITMNKVNLTLLMRRETTDSDTSHAHCLSYVCQWGRRWACNAAHAHITCTLSVRMCSADVSHGIGQGMGASSDWSAASDGLGLPARQQLGIGACACRDTRDAGGRSGCRHGAQCAHARSR